MLLRQRKTQSSLSPEIMPIEMPAELQASDLLFVPEIAASKIKNAKLQCLRKATFEKTKPDSLCLLQDLIAREKPNFSTKSRSGSHSTKNQHLSKYDIAIDELNPTIHFEIQTKKWTYEDDEFLKKLVLKSWIFDWTDLANQFNCTRGEVRRRWQESIYPRIKVSHKIAGAVKWSLQEDAILIQAQKKLGPDWQAILQFLPSRSICSTEGRWRRLNKDPQSISNIQKEPITDSLVDGKNMNKFLYRKQIIKIIGAKKDCPWLQDRGKLVQCNPKSLDY